MNSNVTAGELVRIAIETGVSPSELLTTVERTGPAKVKRMAPAKSEAARPNLEVKPCSDPMPEFTHVDLTIPVEPNEADWADMNLAELEVIVRPDTRNTQIWEAPDRTWWRNGGYVYLRPSRDGVMRFMIVLRRGANMTDYLQLMSIVEQAKAGKFIRHGWSPYPADDRPGWWYTASRPYDDPYATRDSSPVVFPCTDNRCSKNIHEANADGHVADTIEGDGYTIEVTSNVDAVEQDAAYAVDVRAWDSQLTLTPEQVASLVSDMHWAAESCRRANAAPIDSTVKGMRDPKGYWERRNAREGTVADEVAA